MQCEDLIIAFDRAWNDRDIDSLLQLLTPDCSHFDAYFADLVPAWNIAEYLRDDMHSANVRYTITNIIECNDKIAAYHYTAHILDTMDCVVGTYDGVDRLRLRAGKICRVTDLYIAPPELLAIFYAPDSISLGTQADCGMSIYGIEKILQCRRKLIQQMRTVSGYIDRNLTLSKFAREIDYPKDLISFVLDIHFRRDFDDYVTKCRIDCARDMIRQQVLAGFSSTDLSTDKRIAKRVGFQSHKIFVDAFSTAFDQTPRQWRSAVQQQRFENSQAAW